MKSLTRSSIKLSRQREALSILREGVPEEIEVALYQRPRRRRGPPRFVAQPRLAPARFFEGTMQFVSPTYDTPVLVWNDGCRQPYDSLIGERFTLSTMQPAPIGVPSPDSPFGFRAEYTQQRVTFVAEIHGEDAPGYTRRWIEYVQQPQYDGTYVPSFEWRPVDARITL